MIVYKFVNRNEITKLEMWLVVLELKVLLEIKMLKKNY